MAKDNFSKGIDVSHWQQEINWQKVKEAGISFAIAKATGGNNFQDPKFLVNWVGMKNNDIKGSAYHYLRGDQLVESQITNIKETLIAKCDFDVSNDILAIDVEEKLNEKVSREEMADTLWGMATGLNKTFSNIHIYCSPNYWETKVNWEKYDFSPYKLWIAHWTQKESPILPTTWQNKGWFWWQYSSKGRVDGIIGDVDLDRSHLSGIAEEY